MEIGRKLCSFICEKPYEFYEFVRSVPALGDFGGCSPRRVLESGALMWTRYRRKEKDIKVFYSISYTTGYISTQLYFERSVLI